MDSVTMAAYHNGGWTAQVRREDEKERLEIGEIGLWSLI